MIPLALSLLLLQTEPAAPPDREEAARLEEEEARAAARAEAAREQAEELAQEIELMQAQLVELGRRVGDSEAAALEASSELQRLAAEEAAMLDQLTRDREALIDILAALQRIESQTPPALLTAPEDAAEAARAAALMSEVAPALRERAEELSGRLQALRTLRDEIAGQQSTLSGAEEELAAQRLELQVLIAERRALEARRRNEAQAFEQASSSAGQRARSIRSLINELARMAEVTPSLNPRRLDAANAAIPEPRLRPDRDLVSARPPSAPIETLRFSDARGRLRPPAQGEMYRAFGDPAEDGSASEGLFIRTRPQAQVVSPFDARVEFAGPFNTYGGVLILDVGDDYYIVLAGMAVTYARAGQTVLAGEPVGAMPAGDGVAPDLYLELRRNGDAIDPGPWIRDAG
ncbi:murein hydrolase activator EnvC family protein [Maricaulis sp. CAU 1757]